MIKSAVGGTIADALQKLHESQRLIDRVPELGAAGARLSQVIYEIEEWTADQILAGKASNDGGANLQDPGSR